MKYAFTTLGCPRWNLATIIRSAGQYGYHAVDFRGYLGEMALWNTREFGPELGDTARRFQDAGIEVSCVSTGIKCMDSDSGASMDEAKRSAEVARALGASQLRVFGGAYDESATKREDATARLAETLRSLAEVSGDCRILLETHDAWTDSESVSAAMIAADHPRVRVCWDVKHTYWVAGETPTRTWAGIGSWVSNTHWKDVRRGESSRPDRLCLLGDGHLPLADAYQVVAASAYDGYLTLEWEKKWHPHIEEPELAFPQFIKAMNRLQVQRLTTTTADAALFQ